MYGKSRSFHLLRMWPVYLGSTSSCRGSNHLVNMLFLLNEKAYGTSKTLTFGMVQVYLLGGILIKKEIVRIIIFVFFWKDIYDSVLLFSCTAKTNVLTKLFILYGFFICLFLAILCISPLLFSSYLKLLFYMIITEIEY